MAWGPSGVPVRRVATRPPSSEGRETLESCFRVHAEGAIMGGAMRTLQRPLLVLSAMLLVAGCAAAPQRSVIRIQPDGLRTFTVIRQTRGVDVLCPAFAAVDPVSGELRGDPTVSPEKLWMERDGQRISVVWPEGFSLRFEPDAGLYDEHGSRVGHEGDVVTLDQVNVADHRGTFDDPYIAQGIVFGGCYPFLGLTLKGHSRTLANQATH